MNVETSKKVTTKWSKKLYENHGYSDNYIDKSTFLKLKQTNVNTRTYTYWSSVIQSGSIIQQINSVALFLLIYVYLSYNIININQLVIYFSIIIVILYIWKHIDRKTLNTNNVKNDLLNVIKYVTFVYGLCPIISSLTLTISNDTIYAISTIMLFINLIFHDYDTSSSNTSSTTVPIVSKTLSFNAALFSCVCLVSRFHLTTSTEYTFCLITISFILFALWPDYRNYLNTRYAYSIQTNTILTTTLTLFALITIKLWQFVFLYMIIFLFITFLCPYLLIKLQPYKATIHGPWDEALIKL